MIRVVDLHKSFAHLHVLDNLNFSVAKKERVVLLGINGAGKTTLMKILATLSKPSAGEILIDGRSTKKDANAARSSMGMVSHSTFLYSDLTAGENLAFFGKLFTVPDLNERIVEVLEQFELLHRKEDLVKTFSRGMQQRLALARATLHQPKILLLDEPFAGLDVRSTQRLLTTIAALNEKGTTLFMTTHDIDLAREIAPRLIVLQKGKTVLDGKSRDHSTQELTDILIQQ